MFSGLSAVILYSYWCVLMLCDNENLVSASTEELCIREIRRQDVLFELYSRPCSEGKVEVYLRINGLLVPKA